ncbi:MAG: AMP-binding protein [Spirochaetes bacterium]|uniref:AMP-binding protein n=1 Tax=Candidatus Avitreponema avistercoris TaxID=2840705 RepID=A0A9D9HEC6_9SPIR|nr:AMP-binding protein [Candidatus Avitreponema avistercoris]
MEEVFLPRVEFDSYGDFFNNYRVNVPEPFNFAYDVMDVLAAKSPDARALVWTNDEGCFCEFSYGELKRRTDAAASFFRAQGIGRGDMVMLILQRRYEFWISILALHKLGVSVIPATHMLTREDIEYRNNAAGIKAVVAVADGDILRHVDGSLPVSPALKVRIAVNPHGIDVPFGQACVSPDGTEHPAVDLPSGWLDFTAGAAAAAPFTPPPRAEVNANHDIMLAYFTSGTTSHPKLVAHDFTYPLGHIVTAKYWQRVRKGGLHLTVADTGWGKAVWGKLYGQFICECAVFVYDYHARFKPIDLIHKIEEYRITSFCAPPTIYRFLIQEDLSGFDLSSLEHCSTAGEPLSEEVFNQWKKLTGLELKEGFGQTETALSLFNFGDEKVKPGSIGKPAPYYNCVLLNDSGQECQDGEVGEIAFPLHSDGSAGYSTFRGRAAFPGLFLEYFRDEAKTAEVIRNGYYFTGDTAWRDEDGFFWFTGRSDDVIKCSGYRIGTFEVESVLMQHPAVLECAVTAAPDPVRGQVVKATIVLTESFRPGSEELKKDIQRFVKETTAPYKYPRIVEFTDELPKTISGKIKRKDIRAKD